MPRYCYLCNKKANENISLHRFPKEQQLRSKWLKACNLSEVDDVSKIYICSRHFKEAETKNKVHGKYAGKYVLAGVVPALLLGQVVPKICAKEVVNVTTESVQYQDAFIKDMEKVPPNKQIINDKSNKSAAVIDGTLKQQQPSILLEENTDSQDIASNNISCILNENRSNNEGVDDIEGFKGEEMYTPRKRRFSEPRYVSELNASDVATPRRAKRIIALVKRNDAKKQETIKKLHRQRQNLLKRITCLEETVKHLQRGLVSESAGESVVVKYCA